MIDVYRPLTVLLDAVEFAALKAMGIEPYEPGVTFGPVARPLPPSAFVVDHNVAVESMIRSMFPHLDITVRWSAIRRERECFARCVCGARFSLRPLDERMEVMGFEPGRAIASWLFAGLDAHHCVVYP